ncbi:acyl--CoA ligase [Leptolyngbya sp. FACHB-711]|uniref:acyl--CoA ligase n=1 Tax=unclassified Leptolyngbya TaxID=2650499 RepID=UPI001685873E|nr:acyl--CoA ligase [Leptolyngbya sp. FACHB-711]MBD1851807.1 AMP-binding protein [Cyanobacteria bacterium FACHB-502]MBD2026134.1 AMP-binding protein [Leptolyngbya sp. FACHB-711]
MTATLPPSTTLLDLLLGEDDQIALIAPNSPGISYRQLRQHVVALVETLNQFGIGRGDRIVIAMPNGVEMIITYLAAAMCGTAAPLNPKYKPEEFAFYYEDTQAAALITLNDGIEAARSSVLPEMLLIKATANPDGMLTFEKTGGAARPAKSPELAVSEDVAMILHTSGTTSRPKRVPIRHRNLAASATNIIGTYGLTAADRALCIMPLFHVHGIVASMLSTLASGGTVICPNGFNAMEFWSILTEFQPTWYSAVPTMHQLLLSRAERNREAIAASRLRFIRSSSSSLPPIILERLEQTFNAPVLEAYSMTEAAHQMTSNPMPPAAHKAGTVGYGHGVEVGIMNEAGNLLASGELGEVVVRGANVVDGYENNPEANAKAFTNRWFRTGDQGYLDPEGYLSLTGRIKELINRGGEKISPLEVDNLLLRHSAVAEAIAFAVPHKMLGEDIHAAVVLKGDRTASEKELRDYCAEHLAEFKIPRQFHLLTEIPRGATGKLQRLKMAELLNLSAEGKSP